jgi:hypothetical protein
MPGLRLLTATEVCGRFKLNYKAKQLLRDNMEPCEFAIALIENEMSVDAIKFMAHALPAREGIWWGSLCMQHASGGNLSPADRAAATAAVQWVLRPSEENRAAAGAGAQAAPPPSIAGAVATAAFHTGGNIAPPGMPFFKAPEPFAPAKSIALAVKLASVKTEALKIPKMQKSYVELAIEVAKGRFI